MDLGFGDYFQFLFALIFVLALIGALALVARRLGLGYRVPSRSKHERRLTVVEFMPIDARRRLAIIRRDSVEHLIMLGASSETVVETGFAEPSGNFEEVLAESTASDTEERS